MSDASGDFRHDRPHDPAPRAALRAPGAGPAGPAGAGAVPACASAAGAEWLASASPSPRGVRAGWAARPDAPSVLPCGRAFDVVNLPALFGRAVLDRMWSTGPGCGPAASHLGRVLVFAAPGTAGRLPSLLAWEEWGSAVPALLCHGSGDQVTIPPLVPAPGRQAPGGSRWLVAPGVRQPWLPGAGELLWACLRAARPATGLGSAQVGGAGGPGPA